MQNIFISYHLAWRYWWCLSGVWSLSFHQPLVPLVFLLFYSVCACSNIFLRKFCLYSLWVWPCFLGHTGKGNGLVSVSVGVFLCGHKMPCALEKNSSCKCEWQYEITSKVKGEFIFLSIKSMFTTFQIKLFFILYYL